MSTPDYSTLGDFFSLLYRQGQLIAEHEIAHSINNHLSVLSMQVNMISRGFERGDFDLVQRKISEITETSARIQNFARTLSETGDISSDLTNIDLDAVVRETLAFTKVLPALATVQFDYVNPEQPRFAACYADGIKLIIISFLYSAVQVIAHPVVRFALSENSPDDPVKLVCEVLNAPATGEDFKYPMIESQHPGATPMRQLKRILESEDNNLELTLMEGDRLQLICTIANKP